MLRKRSSRSRRSLINFLEGNEDLTIKLVDPPAILGDGDIKISATASEAAATMTIADNETATISLTATDNATEVSDPQGSFTIVMSKPASNPVTVSYTIDSASTALSAASGSNPQDYTPLTLSVTIPANQTSAQIFVNVLDDLVLEGTETVKINLTSVTSLSGVTASGTGTVQIFDNDAAKLVISKVTNASEPSTNGQFVLKLIDTGTGLTSRSADSATLIDFGVTGSATPTNIVNPQPAIRTISS